VIDLRVGPGSVAGYHGRADEIVLLNAHGVVVQQLQAPPQGQGNGGE